MFANPWTAAPREIACRRCRIRKKRCDHKRPVCGECARAGEECQILKPKKTNTSRDAQASYLQALEDHVASLESRLRQSHPSIAVDHLSPHLRDAAASPSAILGIDNQGTDSREEEAPRESIVDEIECAGLEVEGIEASLPDWPIDPLLQPPSPVGFVMEMPSDSHPDDLLESHQFDHHTGASTIMDLTVDDGQSFRLDLAGSALGDRHISTTMGYKLATEFFEYAHPMWPILHQKQWNECWSRWETPEAFSTTATWMRVVVDMVLSVGALLLQNRDPAPEHLESFKFLNKRALSHHDSYERQGWSALLKAQTSLLLTIQALHLDSVDELCNRASDAMKQCAIAKLETSARRSQNLPHNEIQAEIQRQTSRCCYSIDILISYSTNQGVSLSDQSVEDELLSVDDAATSPSWDGSESDGAAKAITNEDRMFLLRRIQYRILRIVQRLRLKAERDSHPIPNLWRSQIRHEVTRWMDDAAITPAPTTKEGGHGRFTSQSWLRKLGNYTIISLFPNPVLAVRSGDAQHLASAACQVLITFRRFRVKDHITCHTWTALIHQFQAGVVLVYCLWATPTHLQPAFYDRRETCRALFACAATLVDYANKWSTAHAFRDVFDLLTDAVPVSEFGDPMQNWGLCPDGRAELYALCGALERLKVQRSIVALLYQLAGEARPAYRAPVAEEAQWLQYTHGDGDEEGLNGGGGGSHFNFV